MRHAILVAGLPVVRDSLSRRAYYWYQIFELSEYSAYLCFRSLTGYYPVAEPRTFLKDRLWTMYFIGFTPRSGLRKYGIKRCARLARNLGYDHFMLWFDHCFSSYAMPANLEKVHDLPGKNNLPEEEYRTFSLPYFIKGLSKATTSSPGSSWLVTWRLSGANAYMLWVWVR